jgi:hypothetical protein
MYGNEGEQHGRVLTLNLAMQDDNENSYKMITTKKSQK